MSTNRNHNWQYEALQFLLNLCPVKQEKDIKIIRRASTDLLKIHAHAEAAALIRLEDEITARVLYATETAINGFANAAIIATTIAKNEIVYHNGNDLNYEDTTIAILLPINVGIYTGVFVLYIDKKFEQTADFRQFLEYAWTGLKDITMLVQSYYAIEELTTRFNAILGTVTESIVFVDDTGKDGWINNAAAELLNIKRNKNSSIVISEAMQRLRMQAVNSDDIARRGAELFSSPHQRIRDWTWIYGNPVSKVLNVSCTPTISENIKGRLWIFTDITAAHLLNEELAEKRKLADEQNKAKSDFLANMSHEIRTPMNGVIGVASLLANTPLNDEQRDYLDIIRISGESLLAIINDILDFSKIESGKMELEAHPFRINAVIEETYDLLSLKAHDKGLDLLYQIDPDVPNEIIGDIVRFRQILTNLVSNGLKFTDAGEVFISVRSLGCENEEYTLQFTVKDTGIGIPEDKYHKLFDSFSQLDSSTTRKYGGTGLGLAICQHLVRLMGGEIHVESGKGLGASFIFTIKVQAGTENLSHNLEKKSRVTPLEGKTILVLDDNTTSQEVLKAQFRRWGMDALACGSYDIAVEYIETKNLDLAVIDMTMPGTNGIEIAELIEKKRPGLPLILLSSANHLAANDQRIQNLFAAVVNKPVKYGQLEEALSRLFGTDPIPKPSLQIPAPEDASALPINILVAEDEEINQKIMRRALEKLGYSFDLAGNGKQAVEMLAHKQYHLVFMDVMMPEMDGYEATRIINEMYGDKRPVIIALTANALTGDKEKTLAKGMDDYISKPYKIQDIKNIIQKWEKMLIN